ncbi:AfsA-related hotdog domain-containing protein [Nocardiopsis sediminis]|uniref:AfsA-related hotdog domain-containing protein n=1 Tax=Nocardiopsis sediminis TaxID=1778267 RepID=A0ABV8FII5_9ACTN
MEILTQPPAAGTSPAEPAPMLDVDYDRTVSRAMVHRWSLSEVFLTDSRPVDETRFVAAAQLPLSHAYFGDHPGLPAAHDPLLVLEACRQAVTNAAHVHHDLPASTTFMVTSWMLDIADQDAMAHGVRPGSLYIEGEVTTRQKRGGRLRRLVFEMDLRLDGRPLGRLSMDVSCTPTDQYHALRGMQRGGEVPNAFALPADPAAEPLDPARVHRRDPVNSVLDGVVHTDEGVEALLSPRSFRNRSMYDHPYDHVPAMVFSEAARQITHLLTAEETPRPVVRLDGEFRKFAELDAPVALAGAPAPEPDTYRLTAVQQDDVVADITVVLG